ncbi:RNA methyltransferase [Pacificimonas sp. WHA3]|uniref:tRNA (cytidine/uridine-2'-O-)-methyltransferase TrmJ n=1 Tax=Pacificimonas pallii TaxID=2827236 RepID=A0ABS6SH11_9SPHN|nr:RNA methyltransferase [Pacificimonas pallii]MBV7257680.1 RNA methyltransferase [Pacificimonas pallii]
MSAPIIILVRPQLGENIGAAARAMLNFGISELRLVSPRDGWPNPSAGPAAAGADEVLIGAKVYDSVAEAIADCAHVYATTVRKRGILKDVKTPEQAATDSMKRPGRTAILFGAEATGLDNAEVVCAQEIITVPVNPEFTSLNLAQAVILCAYEWSRHRTDLMAGEGLEAAAPQAEVEGLVGQVHDALTGADFFRTADRAPTARQTVRNLLTRPGYTSQEVRTLRGIISALTKPRRAAASRDEP